MPRKRVLPPTYLFLAIVAMAALHFAWPLAAVVPWPWNLLGGLPLVLGVALNLWADKALKVHGTTVKPFEESAALVTGGAYRLSRHPMYLGMVLILLGIALLLGSLTPYVVVPVFAVLMEAVFVRVEERMMRERFGEAWLGYTRQVRRWV